MTDGMAKRSVLVAGATGGLGSAIASILAERGDDLTRVARYPGRLAKLEVEGNRIALDLRNPSSCDEAISSAVTSFGRLDVVVDAVGVVAFGSVQDLSIDAMEELFLTNTFVPIMLARAALGALEKVV